MASSNRGDVYTLELAEEHVANANGNIDRLSEALTQDDTDLVPNTPATGNTQFSASSQQKYQSADGNAYNTGRQTLITTGTTTINSTTPIQITETLTNVAAGTYRICGKITGLNGSSGSTQPQTIRFNGSATITSMRVWVNSVVETTGSSPNYGEITALNADPSVVFGGGGPALNAVMLFEFDGVAIFSVAGTLAVYGRCVTSASNVSWTVRANSFMDLMPVS